LYRGNKGGCEEVEKIGRIHEEAGGYLVAVLVLESIEEVLEFLVEYAKVSCPLVSNRAFEEDVVLFFFLLSEPAHFHHFIEQSPAHQTTCLNLVVPLLLFGLQ